MRFLHPRDDSFRISTVAEKPAAERDRNPPRDRRQSLPLYRLSAYRRRRSNGGAYAKAKGKGKKAKVERFRVTGFVFSSPKTRDARLVTRNWSEAMPVSKLVGAKVK